MGGRLKVVDARGVELDRERDGTHLGELVSVQPQPQAVAMRGLEEATRLLNVEDAAFEKYVGRIGEGRAGRQDLLDRVVHVRVGRGRLGRRGVERQTGRGGAHAGCLARRFSGAEHARLVLGGQAVARLHLGGRRAERTHPCQPLGGRGQ